MGCDHQSLGHTQITGALAESVFPGPQRVRVLGLEQGLEICILTSSLGNPHAGDPSPTLQETLVQTSEEGGLMRESPGTWGRDLNPAKLT